VRALRANGEELFRATHQQHIVFADAANDDLAIGNQCDGDASGQMSGRLRVAHMVEPHDWRWPAMAGASAPRQILCESASHMRCDARIGASRYAERYVVLRLVALTLPSGGQRMARRKVLPTSWTDCLVAAGKKGA